MKGFAQKSTAHEFFFYEDHDQGLIDRVIFLIAIGTHPEATLFLEAARSRDNARPVWKFAIGRSGAAEMVVSYDDKELHHMPAIETFPPSTNSYWRMALKGDER